MSEAVSNVDLTHYPLIRRGKVRDVFDLGDHLLLVASDRISAFDVVLPSLLPMKGVILTRISGFWFNQIRPLIPTHSTDIALEDLNLEPTEFAQLSGRSVVARKAQRIDIECVARAYLAGSAWLEYRRLGTVAGNTLPSGLKRGDRLPDILFTPAIKNDSGHDENIGVDRLVSMVGTDLASLLETSTRRIFAEGTRIAAGAGFVLADSKFEFGWIDDEFSVIDEVLTPDSSRYWDAGDVAPNREPAAYDKQIVRDWLEQSGWNKQAPGPSLPEDIIVRTMDRYRSVATRLEQATLEGAQVRDITWNLEVFVMPKQGVSDPQGDAVRSGLVSLGFDSTSSVRIGKRILVSLRAKDEAEALASGHNMCEQLLANPVIEEYSITVTPAGDDRV